jgi:amino acid transporter
MSVGVSAVFGFFLVIALLFSIQDFDTTVASDVGQPVTQILIDVFGDKGAIALMTLVIVCVWHAGLFSMTSNSRMMFGFARDRKALFAVFSPLSYTLSGVSRHVSGVGSWVLAPNYS